MIVRIINKKSHCPYCRVNYANGLVPLFYDEDIHLAKKFLLRGLPTTIFINKNGEEFARVIGSINFEDEQMIEWLQKFD